MLTLRPLRVSIDSFVSSNIVVSVKNIGLNSDRVIPLKGCSFRYPQRCLNITLSITSLTTGKTEIGPYALTRIFSALNRQKNTNIQPGPEKQHFIKKRVVIWVNIDTFFENWGTSSMVPFMWDSSSNNYDTDRR